MLGHQINLTALNAKSDPAPELVAEFDRKFSRESPEALAWAFDVWRDQSPFFPSIAEIRKLLMDWRRGQREQMELKTKLDEEFLLEERRRQGQVPDFPQVLQQLKAVVDAVQPEHMEREKQFRQRMLRAAQIVPTLDLTEEQIRARREKEKAEIARYREHSNNEFEL